MSLYAISDLHLSLGTNKEMDVFGGRWENYTEKLYENWQNTVKPDDTVIIAGDISWATYLDEAYNDFNFLNSLNGKKILFKGNHDYWWTTLKKLNEYAQLNNFTTLTFMQNTLSLYEDIAICGTRGWTIPNDKSTEEDLKIFNREKERLVLSLKLAQKANANEIIAVLHYPPMDKGTNNTDFIDIMKNYNVSTCVYGHLHGIACSIPTTERIENIDFNLTSCDHLNFTPLLLKY